MARASTPKVTMTALILLLPLQLRAQGTPINNCQIIGRNLDNFEDVCADQPIKTPSIKYLCFSNKKHLIASNTKDLAACPTPKKINLAPSSSNPNQLIKRTRGPAENSELRILLADKNFAPGTLPLIKWVPESGARVYRVEVQDSSQNVLWRASTENNEIKYPSQAAQLQPKNLYRVVVTALDASERPLANDTQVFSFLSEESFNALNKATATINQMTITEDRKALDLALLYLSDGLRSKGKQVLEQRVNSNSVQPEIYTLFAKLCLEEGDRQGAMGKFQKAKDLATSQNNNSVIEESTAALNELKSNSNIQPID